MLLERLEWYFTAAPLGLLKRANEEGWPSLNPHADSSGAAGAPAIVWTILRLAARCAT